jgi:hypothetical protein
MMALIGFAVVQVVALVLMLCCFFYWFYLRIGRLYLDRLKKQKIILEQSKDALFDQYEQVHETCEKKIKDLQEQWDFMQKQNLEVLDQKSKAIEDDYQRVLLAKKQFDTILDHVSKQMIFFQDLDKKHQKIWHQLHHRLNEIGHSTESSLEKRYETALSCLKKKGQESSLQQELGLTEDEIRYLKYRQGSQN